MTQTLTEWIYDMINNRNVSAVSLAPHLKALGEALEAAHPSALPQNVADKFQSLVTAAKQLGWKG